DDEGQAEFPIFGANLLRGTTKCTQCCFRILCGRASCCVCFHLRPEFITEKMVSSNTLVPAGVPSATRRGSDPLLSRMRHSSTSGRYTRTRLLRLRSNRRRTSAAGTSWPPLRTRSRTRRTATSAEGSQRYTFGTRVCGSQQLRQPGRVG